MRRPRIPKKVQTDVLSLCRRRCAMCFGLRDDSQEKDGQIAHLDRDPKNNALDNLCFLCLEHHNQYDSRPSQAKRITMEEVVLYRDKLHGQVAGRAPTPSPSHAESDLTNRNAWRAGRGWTACFNDLENGDTASLHGLIAQTQPFLSALSVGVDLDAEFRRIGYALQEAPPIEMKISAGVATVHGPRVASLFSLAANIGGSTNALMRFAEHPIYRQKLIAQGIGALNLAAVLDEAIQACPAIPAELRTEWRAIVMALEQSHFEAMPVRIESWRQRVRSIFEQSAA